MKIITFYLPQFYTFRENDKWWGEGFTEWTNVKKATPHFKNHYQPRIPLNNNYYCLTDINTIKWQVDLAHAYGIYGLCFYHYWFKSGKQLLEKPVELFLKNKSLDINFCLSWANEPWTRSWDGQHNEIIMPQEYGNEDEWKNHFDYLADYFRDDRYIKINNKPLFVFYRPEIFPALFQMIELWNQMAIDIGFDGISLAIQGPNWNVDKENDSDFIDYKIMYEPGYTGNLKIRDAGIGVYLNTYYYKIRKKLTPQFNMGCFSYDAYCKSIINRKVESEKIIPGFFTGWDNTPRRGDKANVFLGSNPQKFKHYFSKLIKKTRNEYKKDFIFINAWNEWAEGCYLEPDEKYGNAYLEAIKSALQENNEWPY